MKTAIVTDTNSGITAQMAREMGIYLIPMPFFIDGSTYYEGETCTPDFFFRHLKAGGHHVPVGQSLGDPRRGPAFSYDGRAQRLL